MIEQYRKYLVVGYLVTVNMSYISSNLEPVTTGPYAEEVWARNSQEAEQVWKSKVCHPGFYFTTKDIECKEL